MKGGRAEKQILRNIGDLFFGNLQITLVYEGEIYQLGRRLKVDPYLDLFELLKDRSDKNRRALASFTREDFSQIYLFFDYEGQASTASDGELAGLLAHFDNETEGGKLFLSYPMVEAVKHINRNDPFDLCIVTATIIGAAYKRLVGTYTGFQNLTGFSKGDW